MNTDFYLYLPLLDQSDSERLGLNGSKPFGGPTSKITPRCISLSAQTVLSESWTETYL